MHQLGDNVPPLVMISTEVAHFEEEVVPQTYPANSPAYHCYRIGENANSWS